MKIRVFELSLALPIAAALIGCSSDAPTEAPERTGAAAAAVSGGTFDSTNQIPWVGQLIGPTSECSAELVTPNYILTANHCITGLTTGTQTPGGVMANYRVNFTPAGFTQNAFNPTLEFFHTNIPGDPGTQVIVRNPNPIDPNSREDNASDLALIRLDSAVPTGVVPLAPIAGFSAPPGAPPCNAISGDAVLVGFGPLSGSACLGPDVVCSPPNTLGRNFASGAGWSPTGANAGDRYLTRSWSEFAYQGTTHGDSGGALFWVNEVCGINSGFAWNGSYIAVYDAQVDSFLNAAFLANNLRNTDGSLKGTCNVTNPGFLGVGNEAGGTVVEIDGAGFDTFNPPKVLFGGNAATVTCKSTSQCFATAPAGTSGTVPVQVSMWTNAVCTGNPLTFRYGPPVPSCTASYSCTPGYTGETTISCPYGTSGLTLLREINGTFQPINANTTQALNAFVDSYSPPAGTQIVYEVEATDPTGTTIGPPLTVTATDCSCHPLTTCTLGCGTVSDGCGGTVSCGSCAGGYTCSSNVCCPSGTSWCPALGACDTLCAPKTCTTAACRCEAAGGTWTGKACM
jgi:hypothetical protein